MKPLRVLAAGIAAAVLGVAGLSACSSSTSSNGDYVFDGKQNVGSLIPEAQRKPAENITGDLLAGGTYDLAKYQGKAVVVNFWATWCGPCQLETPEFAQIYDNYKSKDVTFVGVDVSEATVAGAKSFVAEHHVTYPILYDELGKVALTLGNIRAGGMPYTVLLDKRHRVAGVYVQTMNRNDLEPMLNTLIAEH